MSSFDNAVSFPRTVAILKLVIVAFKLTKGVDLFFIVVMLS